LEGEGEKEGKRKGRTKSEGKGRRGRKEERGKGNNSPQTPIQTNSKSKVCLVFMVTAACTQPVTQDRCNVRPTVTFLGAEHSTPLRVGD